jgi:hypothetical protein
MSPSCKVAKCPLIASDEGFFLGTGPLFDLTLTVQGFLVRWVFFEMDHRDRWIKLGGATTSTLEMFPSSLREIVSSSGI